MTDKTAERNTVELPLDYGFTAGDLKPEPDTAGSGFQKELWRLAHDYSEAEVERILRHAIALYNFGPFEEEGDDLTLGQALHTAAVWERG